VKVSGPEGGQAPRFRDGGREIVYIVPRDPELPGDQFRVMRVEVAAGRARGAPQEMFKLPRGTGPNHVAMSADGLRFLIASRAAPRYAPLTVIVNWISRVREK
jgi:hypothetical protein